MPSREAPRNIHPAGAIAPKQAASAIRHDLPHMTAPTQPRSIHEFWRGSTLKLHNRPCDPLR